MRAGRKEKPEHLFPLLSALVGISGGDSGLIFVSGKAVWDA